MRINELDFNEKKEKKQRRERTQKKKPIEINSNWDCSVRHAVAKPMFQRKKIS